MLGEVFSKLQKEAIPLSEEIIKTFNGKHNQAIVAMAGLQVAACQMMLSGRFTEDQFAESARVVWNSLEKAQKMEKKNVR